MSESNLHWHKIHFSDPKRFPKLSDQKFYIDAARILTNMQYIKSSDLTRIIKLKQSEANAVERMMLLKSFVLQTARGYKVTPLFRNMLMEDIVAYDE